MIKQTMAALLMTTGLAAAQSVDYTGITIDGTPVLNALGGTANCLAIHVTTTDLDGTATFLAASGTGVSCDDITWTQAASYVSSTYGVTLTGFNHGSTLVSQGQAGPPRDTGAGNTGATDVDGDTFDYAIWSGLPAGSTSRGTLNVNGNLRSSDDVTGNGYYMRSDGRFNLVSNWQVAPRPMAPTSAVYTGVSVYQSDGTTGGPLDTTSHLATVEQTTGGNCWVRTTVRPLQATGQRHLLTGRCDSYTWDSLDRTLSWVVRGVPAGQGGRLITQGIAPLQVNEGNTGATDVHGDTFDYTIVDGLPSGETVLGGPVTISGSLVTTSDITGNGYYSRPDGNFYHVTGYVAAPNPTDFGPFNPRQNVEDNDGDTFSYSIWTPNGEPDVTFEDGTLIISSHTVGQGPSAVTTVTVQGDVTGNGAYRDTETSNYYRVTGYQAYVAPEGSNDIRIRSADNPGVTTGSFTNSRNGATFTYTRVEIVGTADHTLQSGVLGIFQPDNSIDFDIASQTTDQITANGYYAEQGSSSYYFHIEDYTPAAAPTAFPGYEGITLVSDNANLNGRIITSVGPHPVDNLCLINIGGTTVSPNGNCNEITWTTVARTFEQGLSGNVPAGSLSFAGVDNSFYVGTTGPVDPNAEIDQHAAYRDRTSAAVAVGDFDWDNNLIITVSDGILRVPADNADNLCELDGGSGTYVIQAGSCSVATWADALAQGEVGMQNRALRGVPVNWLDLTIASTLPGAAPIVEDPADTLSGWSDWSEVSREDSDDEVEVSVSYKGKTISEMVASAEVTEQRTRTVVVNGVADDTPPAGELMQERTRTIAVNGDQVRAALLERLKAQYAAANSALKKQLESDIDYGTKLTANLKNGDKFVLNLTTVGIEYHRTYDIVKDGNTFHITPRVVAGGFIGGDANYIGGGADINVEIKAIKEALVKVGFDTGTYFKYWAGERDGFDELSGTGLTATRFYLDATKDYKGITYNARVATDGVVHVEARKDKFTLGANTEGQLKVGYKTDFDTSALDAPINDSVAAVKTSSKKVFAKILGLFGRD